jgi:murein L,D-transpeptidase YcbB/YkuD
MRARRAISAWILLGLMAGCGGAPRPPATDAAQVPVRSAQDITKSSGAIGAPRWVDAAGRPNRDARDAMALLADAVVEGLDPRDYDAARLQALAVALDAAREPPATDVTTFDASLSVNTLSYFRHVHAGRIDPRAIGFEMNAPPDDDDFAAILGAALAGHRIREAAAALPPPLALYRDLRGVLARYRSLAADPSIEPLPPPGATVHPGESYAGVAALHRLLVRVGDLPADSPPPVTSSAYGGALIDGVKHFQIRHGLRDDGVMGQETQAALGVPLSRRVRQIELALERLRWLPHLGLARLLVVNIPTFQLWGWDAMPADGAPTLGMKVIVGRALNTRTPVFVEEMPYIIFRPYWNVPPSIARQEIVPALQRDPEYLTRQDMQIVSGQGDDARVVALSGESLALVRQGALRVRQRPGPKNSLGLVKFVFPNDDNVYLHGTPALQLFGRSRRDFSHGCVRVEDPVALAAWVLKDQPDWTQERILEAMNANRPLRVDLQRPIQVILFYVTALVMPEDGTMRFAEDIYRHDVRLDRALARRPLSR